MSPLRRLSLSPGHLLRPPFDLSLYLVANRPAFQDESLFLSKIRESVEGGVSCVQLRDHQSDFEKTVKMAAHLREMLRGVSFFVNTHKVFEVAQAADADGVFLEEKVSISEARERLGPKAIIGMSVRTMDDVLAVGQSSEIDYLSVKISPSKRTCPRNDEIWGMEGFRRIRKISPHRIIAIGGLNLARAESVFRELYFDDGIAMAGGLMREEDPRLTAQNVLAIRQRVGGGV